MLYHTNTKFNRNSISSFAAETCKGTDPPHYALTYPLRTRLRAERPGFSSQQRQWWDSFSSPSPPASSWTHPASYTMGNVGPFPGGKATGAWNLPHASI